MTERLRTAALAEADRAYLGGILRQEGVYSVQPLPLSAQAYLAWGLWELTGRTFVWVTDSARSLDLLHQDLRTLTEGHALKLVLFPPGERTSSGAPDPDRMGERLLALDACSAQPPPAVVLTCIQALLQKTISPSQYRRGSIPLQLNQTTSRADLIQRLEAAGYEFSVEIEGKGQAAQRGGLIDIWPPTEAMPVRLEFFGDLLDSIRLFDPASQRSVEKRSQILIPPASEQSAAAADFLTHLDTSAGWVWSDPGSIRHHAELFRNSLGDDALRGQSLTYATFRKRLGRKFPGAQMAIGTDGSRPETAYACDFAPLEALASFRGGLLEPDLVEEARRRWLADLGEKALAGWSVHLFFNTDGARERFQEMQKGIPPGVHLHQGPLTEGFRIDQQRVIVVAESDLYGRRHDTRRLDLAARRRGPAPAAGPRLTEWTDIQPGDYVVHVDHGIGRYRGLFEIVFNSQNQEVLAVEYAEGAKLYVPVAQAHLLSRYVGVGRRRPELHALGSKRWLKEKVTAEKAVRDLAAGLLETQAAREAQAGHAFGPDTPWQHEFEASFPYQETPDQERAIREIKQDMETPRPMDRLVCGDVGYGKTEVAMRAAFKAVMGGQQVALLVPTTVLAQQHFDTFYARMEAFPVRLAMLSRFQTRREQQQVVARIRKGEIDIVIGTHRLIQPDVQFPRLGLLIIDEEQRFGVEQKEHLKIMRRTVDVLTLTATPIPRTLYLSLTGARDMSTIQTPPQERLPIETIVTENRDELVRDAILHELSRGGQVFYLHNRVRSIGKVWERLRSIVPEARAEVAHGQMAEGQLAKVMRRFVAGEFDVLLCTTIIESGVDIPNVNTILIDRADRFGLSDLYQLRGRVGRYKHKAYAHFLLPRHGRLFDTARRRIAAIRRYSSLGAGFKLALRDLEIRGAGNLLGAEQSGHIAAVGFDLYCQLLRRSVARLKGETPPPIIEVDLKLDFLDLAEATADETRAAVIPTGYIEDESLRVAAYRKLAAAATEKEVDALAEEFRDRFGTVPAAVTRLLELARLRVTAAANEIRSVEVAGEKVVMIRHGQYLKPGGRFPRVQSREADRKLAEVLRLVRAAKAP